MQTDIKNKEGEKGLICLTQAKFIKNSNTDRKLFMTSLSKS